MSRFQPVIEVVESLCLRSGDLQMRNKGLYLDCVEDTFNDLNESVLKIAERVKIPVRRRFHVNKHLNTITLPCRFDRVASVDVMVDGVMYPVFRNDKIHDDLVEISEAQDCCENNCAHQLCNAIKGYEVVRHTETDKNPDGSDVSFECIDKKVVIDKFLYEQKQYPLRQYVSGVWVSTVLHTENVKLCEVEVDANGCVCDSDANIDKVCNACGISSNDDNLCCVGGSASVPPEASCDQWTYYCMSKLQWFMTQCGGFRYFRKGCNNIYNISEDGKRLIFPPNFGFGEVIVRMYMDIDQPNLMIPYLAKPTFMTGLQYFASIHNEKKMQLSEIIGQRYSRMKMGLFQELNKYRLAELRMIANPPVHVPSYNQTDNYYRDF